MIVNSFNKSVNFINFEADTSSVVYKIVFPDNMFYIGCTIGSIEDRIHDHCKDSVKGGSMIDKKIRESDAFKVIKMAQVKDAPTLRFNHKRILQWHAKRLLEIMGESDDVKLSNDKVGILNEFILNEKFYF